MVAVHRVPCGPADSVVQAFEDQQDELGSFVRERTAAYLQIHFGYLAPDNQFHSRLLARHAPASGSSLHCFAHRAIGAGGRTTTSPRRLRRMHAMQHFPDPPLYDRLLVRPKQSGRRRVAFQDAHIFVHHKNGHGHGIEQHPVKSLIQKLNSNPIHENPVY